MANLTNALQQLREEREKAQSQVEKLESAISVIENLVGTNGSGADGCGRNSNFHSRSPQTHGRCSEGTMGEGAAAGSEPTSE